MLLLAWPGPAWQASSRSTLRAGPGHSPGVRILPLRVAWTVALPAEPVGAPAVDADRVFLTLADGEVTALARADGTGLWSAAIEATGAPLVDGPTVIVATARGLVALRASDGTTLWRRTEEVGVSDPAVGDGWVVYGTAAGDLLAVRAQDGAEVWRRPLGAAPAGRATIAGPDLFVPLADARVAAVRLASGEPRWTRMLGGRPDGITATTDRVLVGATDNFLYCLARADGRVLWRWRTSADIVAPPAVDARDIYLVSLDNLLRALDRGSGSLRWSQLLESRHLGGPQAVAGLVVAPVRRAVVLFYASQTGRPVAGLNLPGSLVAPLSRLEAGPDGGGFFAITVDAGGAVQLSAVAPAADPVLGPLETLPGRVLDVESLTRPPAPPPPGTPRIPPDRRRPL